MKEIHYVIWQEGKHFVAQCLEVEVSSFGDNVDEAKKNLKEAVELYFEGENVEPLEIGEVVIGRELIHV
jgi:predicted RNase H-like HicB family nuclease